MNLLIIFSVLFVGSLAASNNDSGNPWNIHSNRQKTATQIVVGNMVDALIKGLNHLEQILPEKMQPLVKSLRRSHHSSEGQAKLRSSARAILGIAKKSVAKFEAKMEDPGKLGKNNRKTKITRQVRKKLEERCFHFMNWIFYLFGWGGPSDAKPHPPTPKPTEVVTTATTTGETDTTTEVVAIVTTTGKTDNTTKESDQSEIVDPDNEDVALA